VVETFASAANRQRPLWRSAALALLSLLLVATEFAPGLAAPSEAPLIPTVPAEVFSRALFAQNIPGIAIAVVRNGRTILDRGYGYRNIDPNLPVETNSAFEIGSITKQFTAVAILQLKERGRLKLSDTLGQYIPEYSRGKDVTIEQLLHQTSGIPDNINSIPNAVKVITSRPGSLKAVLALIGNMPLVFKPGTQWDYSNTNYYFLGVIVSRVSGMTYDQYVAKNIFAPAGMTHSTFTKDESSLSTMAIGYQPTSGGPLERAKRIGYGWSQGAGSILSTAGDVAKWDDAFFSGRVASASDVRFATTPAYIQGKSTHYGCGWRIDETDGVPTISHDGATLGFNAINDVFPTLGLRIIVLANNGAAFSDAIAKDILASLNPAFAESRDTAAPGESPAITNRIRTVWSELHQGTIDRSQLSADLSNEITAKSLQGMHVRFARLDGGAKMRWIYKGQSAVDEADGGGLSYSYRVLLSNGYALAVTTTIDKDGKISACDTAYD
jgi:D-alanyl-D-alanine carboxypeptidase